MEAKIKKPTAQFVEEETAPLSILRSGSAAESRRAAVSQKRNLVPYPRDSICLFAQPKMAINESFILSAAYLTNGYFYFQTVV